MRRGDKKQMKKYKGIRRRKCRCNLKKKKQKQS